MLRVRLGTRALYSSRKYLRHSLICHHFIEQVKSMLLTVVISIPVLSCVLKIIELGGKYFYVYLWAFCFVFSIVMLTIVPVVIMPLFNTYSPLEVHMSNIRAGLRRTTTESCVGQAGEGYLNPLSNTYVKWRGIELPSSLVRRGLGRDVVRIAVCS